MKKKYIKLVIVTIFILVFAAILFWVAQDLSLADAGGFRGSSSFSSGSSRSSSRGSSSSGGSGAGWIIYAFIRHPIISSIFLIVLFIFISKGAKKKRNNHHVMRDYQAINLSFINEYDPAFSVAQLQTRMSRVYIEMQRSWTNKNFEPMRAYLTSQLFSEMNGQLEQLKMDRLTNYVERTAVLNVIPIDFRVDEINEIITFILVARNIDYTLRDDTGEVIVGSKTQEVFMTYKIEVVRTKGAKTVVQQDNIDAQSCPNCGAPIDLNSSGKCEYCGAILEAKTYDWVISNITAIQQS